MTSIHPKSEKARIAHAQHTGEGREKVHVQPSGAAHVVYDEPTCIGCGCTTFNACPPTCYWVYLEEATNRGLCSQCHAKGINFTRVAMRKEEIVMAAKKSRKAKKKRPASKRKEIAAPAAGWIGLADGRYLLLHRPLSVAAGSVTEKAKHRSLRDRS